jgi:hypothetical protein
MKWALDIVALHKTIAQIGAAMAADVVDGKNTIVYFKNSNVLVLWRNRNTSAFKQICLCGNIGPLTHD